MMGAIIALSLAGALFMAQRTIGALVYDKFELLDYFGPMEMFGVLPDHFRIHVVAQTPGSVASTQGPRVVVDQSFEQAEGFDLLWVPGGVGTRQQVENETTLEWLRAQSDTAQYVASVCTGSGLLAAAGLLDGRRATSNKMSFRWAESQSDKVTWLPKARWVEDGKFWTSGGVAAGIDMALAMISNIVGEEIAERVADGTEYDWHRDAGWDPFAEKAGLV